MSQSISKSRAKIYRDRSRAKRAEAGLCIECGKNEKKETSKLCHDCTRSSIERRKVLKEARIKLGICGHCLKRDASSGMKLCEICREKKRVTGDAKIRKRCLNYGITEDHFHEMVKSQNGKCAICRRDPGGRWNELNIDHCHETGRVRGLLCGPCNKALGCLQDSKEILLSAISYIEGTDNEVHNSQSCD